MTWPLTFVYWRQWPKRSEAEVEVEVAFEFRFERSWILNPHPHHLHRLHRQNRWWLRTFSFSSFPMAAVFYQSQHTWGSFFLPTRPTASLWTSCSTIRSLFSSNRTLPEFRLSHTCLENNSSCIWCGSVWGWPAPPPAMEGLAFLLVCIWRPYLLHTCSLSLCWSQLEAVILKVVLDMVKLWIRCIEGSKFHSRPCWSLLFSSANVLYWARTVHSLPRFPRGPPRHSHPSRSWSIHQPG